MSVFYHASLVLNGVTVGHDVFSDGDDWDLAFRGTAGAKVSVYSTYTNTQTGCVEPSCLDVRYICAVL